MNHDSFLPLRPAVFQGRPDAPKLARAHADTPAATQGDVPPHGLPLICMGVARADAWLGGGLRRDGLHEFFAGQRADLPTVLSFALILALMRGTEREKPELLWLRCGSASAAGVPYAPGLADLRLDPRAITLLHLADERALLRAALEAVRAGAVGTVLLELVGRQKLLDLVATRRLVLAAAETGTLVLLVRADDGPGLSAAHSRWEVRSAPSRPMAAGAPGFPVFDLTLLRLRGGKEGLHILLEWNRDTAAFRDWEEYEGGVAPLSSAVLAMVTGPECVDPQDRAA